MKNVTEVNTFKGWNDPELEISLLFQCVLRLLPRLQQLNLAGCVNITDNVFLVDKQKQLTRLTSKQAIPQDFDSQLMDVDVSECAQLTSFAICYLTSLCGPTLRSINISHTAVRKIRET